MVTLQKQKNREETAWIKERQHKCRAMEAEYMRELQENSEKEKREKRKEKSSITHLNKKRA